MSEFCKVVSNSEGVLGSAYIGWPEGTAGYRVTYVPGIETVPEHGPAFVFPYDMARAEFFMAVMRDVGDLELWSCTGEVCEHPDLNADLVELAGPPTQDTIFLNTCTLKERLA